MKKRASLRKIVNWKHFHLLLLAQALPALVFLAVWIGGFVLVLFRLESNTLNQNYGPLPLGFASQIFQLIGGVFLVHFLSIYLLGLIGKWYVRSSSVLCENYTPELKLKFQPAQMVKRRRQKETFWYLFTALIGLFFLIYPFFTHDLPTNKTRIIGISASVPLAFIALRLLTSTFTAYKSAVVYTACLKKSERELPTFWMGLKEDEHSIELHHSAFHKWWLKHRMKIILTLLHVFPFIGVWALQPLFYKLTQHDSLDILNEISG